MTREEAIETIELASAKVEWDYPMDYAAAFDMAIEALKQPERKKGKWIYGENDGQDGWFCSECDGFIPWDYKFYGLDNIDFIKDFKTCPFCDTKMITYTGADMRGKQE